jgi:hypothetical protein
MYYYCCIKQNQFVFHHQNIYNMRSIGFLLLLFGAGSFILKEMNMQFRLMSWVDKWGTDTGNIIKIAFAVVGVILLALSFRKKPDAGANETP